MTAQPDVTTRDGWLFDGHLPTGWEAYGDKCGVDGVPPCLVVTGNLDAARARLEAATPDDVRERAVGIVVGLSYLDPCDGGRIIDALADAGLLRGPETSSAAPEGAALSASGTVRRAGGPDHGTAPVGDDCTSVIASALRDIYAALVGGVMHSPYVSLRTPPRPDDMYAVGTVLVAALVVWMFDRGIVPWWFATIAVAVSAAAVSHAQAVHS